MGDVLNSPDSGLQRQSNRIAKNTVVLFLRMFVLMIINLYIVRLILKGLGAEDYGTFNAVAGVVTALTCISSVLAVATQRFYSFVAGKGDASRLRDIFAVSMNVNLILSVIVLLLFETVGLWYVGTQLPIPAERLQAAIYVYHLSCFSFVCTLIQIPYTAAIIAQEDMGYYALISTGDCLARLLVAFLVSHVLMDHLIFYGGGLLVVAFCTLCVYALVGHRYPECRYQLVKDKALYNKLLSFSGWTFFGALAGVAMFQGNTILLYEFFGPLATAAFAISIQINHAFNSLCNSSVLAFRPAMIRSYAEGEFDNVTKMFYFGNKFILYIFLAISIPLILEMDTILSLWLGTCSAETLQFSRLMIVAVVVMAMHSPITIIMHAAAKVKVYHSVSESVMLLCLPVAWLLFSLGFPAASCFLSMIVVSLLAHLARLYCLKRYYPPFSYRVYFCSLVLPAFLITVFSLAIAYACHLLPVAPLWRLLMVGIGAVLPLFVLVYAVGLKAEERVMVRRMVASII